MSANPGDGSDNSPSPDSPVPFPEYVRPRIDYDGSGLPIPFASCVAPRQGKNEGHELPLGGQPVLTLTGEWEVIGTTGNGYPAVLRTVENEGLVASTLNTVGNNKKYRSAVLGYDPELGSFGLGTVWNRAELSPLFDGQLDYYADASDFENLGSILTDFQLNYPIAVVIGNTRHSDHPTYSRRSRAFVWFRTEFHNPWNVLTQLNLRSYSALIGRYAEGADAIGKIFNTTPPERRHEKDSENIDPDKARELQDLFKSEFEADDDDEDLTWE